MRRRTVRVFSRRLRPRKPVSPKSPTCRTAVQHSFRAPAKESQRLTGQEAPEKPTNSFCLPGLRDDLANLLGDLRRNRFRHSATKNDGCRNDERSIECCPAFITHSFIVCLGASVPLWQKELRGS